MRQDLLSSLQLLHGLQHELAPYAALPLAARCFGAAEFVASAQQLAPLLRDMEERFCASPNQSAELKELGPLGAECLEAQVRRHCWLALTAAEHLSSACQLQTTLSKLRF